MAEWISTHTAQKHHLNASNRKRDGNDAFSDDWGTYENRGGHQRHRRPHPDVHDLGHKRHHTPPTPSFGRKHIETACNPYSGGRMSSSSSPLPETYNQALHLPPELVRSCTMMRSGNFPRPTVVIPEGVGSTLSDDQRLIVASVLSGYSTFFTGPAGSGKSHVLSSILRLNEDANLAPKRRIVVTATTGIAACAIGGVTIHSFAGVGTGEGKLEEMASRVMGNDYARKRWREVDVLVIDEISMMPAGFFDALDFVASRARNDRRKFGGLQLVVCGDFFQLPPVNLSTGFAFEAKCWPKTIRCSVLLRQVFRQNGDRTLMNILNEARVGELRESSVQALKTHSMLSQAASARQKPKDDSVETDAEVKPTLLECRNKHVDQANLREMAKLPGEAHTFQAKDRAVSKNYEALLRHCSAPEKLSLKVGAQVILLKNIDPENGLVNGTRGVVVDFRKPTKKNGASDVPRAFKSQKLPVVQFDSVLPPGSAAKENSQRDLRRLVEPVEWTNKMVDKTVSSRVQIPLKLAWALSVHKSQGMTIPNLTVNLRGVFEYGQAYVALSRATEMSLLTLRGFDERCFKAHPKVKVFYRLLNGDDAQDPATPRGNDTAVVTTVSDKLSNQSITREQQRRMEENRKRALLKRQQKAASLSSGSSKATPIIL